MKWRKLPPMSPLSGIRLGLLLPAENQNIQADGEELKNCLKSPEFCFLTMKRSQSIATWALLGSWSRFPSRFCAHRVNGRSQAYNTTKRKGLETSHPSNAWPMAVTNSPDAFPVRACQSAFFDNANGLAPTILSPTRRKGTIKLICKGVARKFASIIVGPLHLLASNATAMPQKMTVTPQIGNTPRVMPRAAERASCFGSTPLPIQHSDLPCEWHKHSMDQSNGDGKLWRRSFMIWVQKQGGNTFAESPWLACKPLFWPIAQPGNSANLNALAPSRRIVNQSCDRPFHLSVHHQIFASIFVLFPRVQYRPVISGFSRQALRQSPTKIPVRLEKHHHSLTPKSWKSTFLIPKPTDPKNTISRLRSHQIPTHSKIAAIDCIPTTPPTYLWGFQQQRPAITPYKITGASQKPGIQSFSSLQPDAITPTDFDAVSITRIETLAAMKGLNGSDPFIHNTDLTPI